jgi:hypothetical protein
LQKDLPTNELASGLIAHLLVGPAQFDPHDQFPQDLPQERDILGLQRILQPPQHGLGPGDHLFRLLDCGFVFEPVQLGCDGIALPLHLLQLATQPGNAVLRDDQQSLVALPNRVVEAVPLLAEAIEGNGGAFGRLLGRDLGPQLLQVLGIEERLL